MTSGELQADLGRLAAWITERRSRWLGALEELVRTESPSGDSERLSACASVAAGLFRGEAGATPRYVETGGGGRALELSLGEAAGRPGPLLLGHLDTVWAAGSFQPLFEVDGDRVLGPGVFDMKGGVVVALAAMSALRQVAPGPLGALTLLLTEDEEVGSPRSRLLIEERARASCAVLVLEPGVGAAVKVARKGIAQYRLAVRGRAAHAGLEPEKGVNALLAIAPLVAAVAGLSRPELGTTVSPTVLRGGTRSNVVPAVAELELDVRFATAAEAERVDRAVHGLRPDLDGASLSVAGGVNRPPFEREASAAPFSLAQEVVRDLNWTGLEGAAVGGASDGNFTAALGVPTLDGLGACGGNAHAEGEWASLDAIEARAALLAGCLLRIWARSDR